MKDSRRRLGDRISWHTDPPGSGPPLVLKPSAMKPAGPLGTGWRLKAQSIVTAELRPGDVYSSCQPRGRAEPGHRAREPFRC